MSRTLWLWFAVALLVGALALGNPMRPRRGGSGPVVAAPAAQPVAPPAATSRPAAGPIDFAPSPAAVSLVRHGGAPVEAAFTPCPDPALAPHVVRTAVGAPHGTVWILGDGRRFVRGAAPTGLPLVELLAAPGK